MRSNLVFQHAAVVALALWTMPAQAAPLFEESFDIDSTASWVVNNGPSDAAADFFFDYSTVGIPSAPNSSGGTTRGMKLQANLANGIFSGMSVSPLGQSFSGDYQVRFDWWTNFNGPLPAGGSGSTNLSTFGVGTAGATPQWPGGTQDSVWFGATGDGGSSADWRAYSPAASTSYTPDSGVFAAGTDTSPDARNNSHSYYAGFGEIAAPAAQVALFSQQGPGVTNAGSAAFQWHDTIIEKTGDTITWTVDGTLIATIDASAIVLGGGNIFFGHSDTNATSSTDANDTALLFTLIDNVQVIPEPTSLLLAGLGLVGLMAMARRK